MAKPIDYLRNANNELLIANGDFVKGDATAKHQQTLLITEKGDFKQFPLAGISLFNFLLGDNTADELRAEIQKQFEDDGMKITEMKITGTDVNIDAHYVED